MTTSRMTWSPDRLFLPFGRIAVRIRDRQVQPPPVDHAPARQMPEAQVVRGAVSTLSPRQDRLDQPRLGVIGGVRGELGPEVPRRPAPPGVPDGPGLGAGGVVRLNGLDGLPGGDLPAVRLADGQSSSMMARGA